MKSLVAAALMLSYCGCSLAQSQHRDQHLHYLPAPAQSKGWIAFLPGSSGLTIFEDDRHYFRIAEQFNADGWDVICIDYKPMYRAAKHRRQRSTGQKIKWCLEKSLNTLREEGKITPAQRGALACWSLGAEGGLQVINDQRFCQQHRLKSAVFFYPANQDGQRLANKIPLQINSGIEDDVTPIAEIRDWMNRQRKGSASVERHEFANCHHGFDIESLTTTKVVRLFPWFGPKATFAFNAEASKQALENAKRFINAQASRRQK